MNLFNSKLVFIIEAILLAAALFADIILAPYLCHIIKLALKLGITTNQIKNGIVKKRFKTL